MHYRVCGVGTPGIGKTTCTPILIRMLLTERHTVVYLVQTVKQSGWYYEFTPDERGITTKVGMILPVFGICQHITCLTLGKPRTTETLPAILNQSSFSFVLPMWAIG